MKIFYPLLAVFFLSGCATTFISANSQDLPDAKVVFIKVKNSGSAYLRWSSAIHNVYGMKGQVAPPQGVAASYKSVRLLPGKYTVYLTCQYNNEVSMNDVSVDVDAQAGMTYVVNCQFISHNRMGAIVSESYKTGKQPDIIPVEKANSNTGNQENLDDLKGLISTGKD